MSIKALSPQSAIKVAKAYLYYVVETSDGINRFEGFTAKFEDGEHKLVLRMAPTDEQPGVDSIILSGWEDFTPIIGSLNIAYPVGSK
jgi:hypothetical protein